MGRVGGWVGVRVTWSVSGKMGVWVTRWVWSWREPVLRRPWLTGSLSSIIYLRTLILVGTHFETPWLTGNLFWDAPDLPGTCPRSSASGPRSWRGTCFEMLMTYREPILRRSWLTGNLFSIICLRTLILAGATGFSSWNTGRCSCGSVSRYDSSRIRKIATTKQNCRQRSLYWAAATWVFYTPVSTLLPPAGR